MQRRVLVIRKEPRAPRSGRASKLEESTGADVCIAVQEKAMESLAKALFDLVVVADGSDRLSVLRQVKALRPDTPIVVVTREQSWKEARDALREGAIAVLAEPLRRRDLESVVRRMLN